MEEPYSIRATFCYTYNLDIKLFSSDETFGLYSATPKVYGLILNVIDLYGS